MNHAREAAAKIGDDFRHHDRSADAMDRDNEALVQQAIDAALAEKDAEIASESAVLAMTVARLGGTVEGRPTARLNFLQRVDELVRKEARLAAYEKLEEAARLVNVNKTSRDGMAREEIDCFSRGLIAIHDALAALDALQEPTP